MNTLKTLDCGVDIICSILCQENHSLRTGHNVYLAFRFGLCVSVKSLLSLINMEVVFRAVFSC